MMKIGVISDTHLREPHPEFKKMIEFHFKEQLANHLQFQLRFVQRGGIHAAPAVGGAVELVANGNGAMQYGSYGRNWRVSSQESSKERQSR